MGSVMPVVLNLSFLGFLWAVTKILKELLVVAQFP